MRFMLGLTLGGLTFGGAPITHRMSGHSLAGHVHEMSIDGMVLFGVRLLRVPALMSVKHHVTGGDLSVPARACGALLWWIILRSSMCLFEQHQKRCRRTSFSLMLHWLHRLHGGHMSCLYTRVFFFFFFCIRCSCTNHSGI